jgi:hypothetical protein
MINRIRRAVHSSPYLKPILLTASVWFGFAIVSAQTADTGHISGPERAGTARHPDDAATTETADMEFAAALLAPETTALSNLRTEPAPPDPPLDNRSPIALPVKLEGRR